ncbi:MAG: DMT family transporter, partial [Pseudoruegeria sp.]
ALRYWLVVFALGMGWGASFFFNEILLRELGPLSVSLGRVGVGALGCWIWCIGSGRSIALSRGLILPLAVFGLMQYALPLTIYPVGQQFITSSAAGIINAMTPIMVVIVSHFWPGGEQATVPKSVGVLFGFSGIVILAWPALQGGGDSSFWALLFTIIAPLCYGFAINLLRKMDGMDRVSLTTWSLTFSTLFLAPIAIGIEGVPVITKMETWLALAAIGFVLTSAAFITLFWLIPIIGGTTASTITFIAPVSTLILGSLVLNEVLTIYHFAGMAAIFCGLILIDGRLLKRFRTKA